MRGFNMQMGNQMGGQMQGGQMQGGQMQGGQMQGGQMQGGQMQGGQMQGGQMQGGQMQGGQMQGGQMQGGQMQGGQMQGSQMQGSQMQNGQMGPGEMKGPGGHHKPKLEDIVQTTEQHEDGSVSITVSGTDPEGEVRSKTLTISDAEHGGVELASANDAGKSKVTTVTEDAEDGGVDLDIVCTNEEGEVVTRHIELDLNEDGTISFVEDVVRDGETLTHERTLDVEQFLGEADEALTVAEVVEAMLERGPIDMAEVDLSGINNLNTDVALDALVV